MIPGAVNESDESLLDAAMAFLAAGGRPTLREWADLDMRDRAALGMAHRLLDIRHAQVAYQATQGPEAVADLMADIDDGDAVATHLCQVWAERAALNLNGLKVQA